MGVQVGQLCGKPGEGMRVQQDPGSTGRRWLSAKTHRGTAPSQTPHSLPPCFPRHSDRPGRAVPPRPGAAPHLGPPCVHAGLLPEDRESLAGPDAAPRSRLDPPAQPWPERLTRVSPERSHHVQPERPFPAASQLSDGTA